MQIFDNYVSGVKSGKIVACKYVKLAIARHERDLLRGDVYFDRSEVQFALDFFQLLNLIPNINNFVPFVLEPFQAFIVGSILGWKKTQNRKRKYDRAYIEVARKNGKTFLSAGISLYLLIVDNEPSPEVYIAANSKAQAFICFKDAKDMVMSSPALVELIKIRQFHMSIDHPINGMYKYLSADSKKHDGLRPHCAVLDEIHEYKTNALHNIFASAMGNREQPLILMITTAGFNKTFWCYRDQRKFIINILEQTLESDNVFGIIYTLDVGDDYRNPDVWIKSNPNLGVSVRREYLKQEVRTAEIKPSDRVAILTKNFNIWMDAALIWIDSQTWRKHGEFIPDEDLVGLSCFGGADLSYTMDITCYTLTFTLANGRKYLRHRFFVPKDSAYKRQEATGIPYLDWIKEGHLIACDGTTIDYDILKTNILDDFNKFDFTTMGFDPYNAHHIMQELNAEIPKINVKVNDKWSKIDRIYTISQSFKSISPTAKEFERMSLAENQEFQHDNNPVMAWMVSNVVLRMDSDGNIKPDKGKSEEKIDGVISSLLSLEQDLFWRDKEIRKTSIYEGRKPTIL
jgi:phage terminase large subunit-like protein